MSQAQQKIKWGDILRLHGVSTVPDKEMKGLIISKGFTDPNIYYQTYNQYDEVNFYRESLFQIIPKSNFDLHDQLLFDQKVKEQEKPALRERCKDQAKQLMDNLAGKYTDKDHPDEVNVTYGAEVVFRHIQSGDYLSGIFMAADIGEGAFKLELAKELSSHLIFKLVSHRSYQNEGNVIYFDDCLRIHHIKTDCYMNFPDTEVSIIFDRPYQVAKFDQTDKGYDFAKDRPSIKKPVGRRINVINENQPKCLWKFIQHCRYEDSLQKDKIKSHDIVYFQHTKYKGLVASTLAQQQYYLKEICGSEEVVSYQCFWELIPKEGNQLGPEQCDSFWARNIVTGQILTYNDFKVQIKARIASEESGFESGSLVDLVCGMTQVIQGDDPTPLKMQRGEPMGNDQNVMKVIKYFDDKFSKLELISVEQLAKDSFIIVRVSEDTIRDVSYVLSSQEAFVKLVEIVSTQIKKKNMAGGKWIDFFMSLQDDLLLSFISVLKLLIGKIYDTDYDQIQSSGSSPIGQIQKILVETGIAQILMEIIFTLYDPFFEVVSSDEITDDKPKRLKIGEIFQLSYVLVQHIVKDFEDNKIFFSRWLEHFIQYSNQINKSFIQECLLAILKNNQKSIEYMIKKETINSQIASFFQEASSTKEDIPTKHLRLFSSFIRGQDFVMRGNQVLIFDQFFNTEYNEHNVTNIDYTFKFKVEYRTSEDDEPVDESNNQRNKVIKVIFGREEPCTIMEFFNYSRNKFAYLLNYVSLLADVCMDRNNEAIEYVEHTLPLAVVSNILFDQQMNQINDQLKKQPKRYQITNIWEPFIRIGHHAYVNNHKFSPILRIRKIVKWHKDEDATDANQNQDDITRTKRVFEGEKEEEQRTNLKYLLQFILKFLNGFETQDRRSVSNLQMLTTVLGFLKETILLGLWETIDEFRIIIPLLIKNIIKIDCNILFEEYDQTAKKRYNSGKDWVDFRKEILRQSKPEISLAIECKNKAAEIFKCMNEMEIDIRLRFLMNFFKGIYDASENVENYSSAIMDDVNEEGVSQDQLELIKKRNEDARQEFYKIFGMNILGEIKKYSEDQDMMMKEYLWYNKIKTMIPLEAEELGEDTDKDRDLFKLSEGQDFPFNKIVLSLFQLSGFKNKNLLNSSLNMLKQMFEQRSDIIDAYKNLLICGKGNLSQVYMNLKFMRNKFAMLKDDTIGKWDGNANKAYAYSIFKSYDHLGRQEDKRSGIIQDLFFLARTLKDGVSLKNIESLMFVQKDVFDRSIVYHFYTEKEQNNDLFQQLNMAEGIYEPLISYIHIMRDKQLSEIHRWLLFSIFQYLTLLCFNNTKAKFLFMNNISDILPYLTKRVGASSFLYEVCINNKILVNNQELIEEIFDGTLSSCIELENQEIDHGAVSKVLEQDLRIFNKFQQSRILYSLRSLLIFNDEGHKRNQQLLLNRLSDNKFKRLRLQGQLPYRSKRQDFTLNDVQSYATTHYELFSTMVESQNLINIGKLQNLHPYDKCLMRMQQTNRWQLRRALRSYVNRLYYVHKDKDIFMFEQFIANEFSIINRQLLDLIELHRSKMLTEDLKVKNGIRFCFAQSEIIMHILEILISLHEMFLKKKFRELLLKEIRKQKEDCDFKKNQLCKLLRYLGCINKLYSHTKIITSFIKEIKELMKRHIFVVFHVRYLEKKSSPPTDKEKEEDSKLISDQQSKKSGEQSAIVKPKQKPAPQSTKFNFDRTKTFFRNLISMMRWVRMTQTLLDVDKQQSDNKNQMDVSEQDLRDKYIEAIFAVPHERYLRSIKPIVIHKEEDVHYVQHLQTAHSKMFKLLAKPEYEDNQQNLELNMRRDNVKEMLIDSPAFKKLKQDQFYKLVRIFNNMDDLSAEIYQPNWKDIDDDPRPIFSKKQIISNCFSLIIQHPDVIQDSEKIFFIKLVRCYIAEAVEEKQNHKLQVDKWNAGYYTDDTNSCDILTEDSLKSELVRRQHMIEQCGGSKLLISIFKENLFTKTELLNEALLLGIIYLYNGNTHCQNSLLNELKADYYNLAFMSLRNLIRNIGDFLIEVRKFKENQKERDFSYKIVDSYDHFDANETMMVKKFGHKTDKFELQTELNFELALCRTFRFLQLLCENNNTDLKKFLLKQMNEDGSDKLVVINFIQQACQLLRQFFKIMSIKVVNIPPSILDFINEITQIPCIDCQISLMKSTFFEDMSYMASFFEDKVNIDQRKFNFYVDPERPEDDLNTLSGVYQKGIGLALSNFQGNDNEIFWQYLNKCQPLFLWIVMRQNLIKLLRPNAHKYGVSRQAIEQQLQKKQEQYFEKTEMDPKIKQKERDLWLQFRDYHVQKKFIEEIFSRFDSIQIGRFISEQRANAPEFNDEVNMILNVLIILRKINDYGIARAKMASANPEVLDIEQNQKAFKAISFKQQLYKKAITQYPHIGTFVTQFDGLLVSIQISSDNGNETKVQNLYFPKHPVFDYLANDTRDRVMLGVGRGNRRDKLISLQDHYQELEQQIHWFYELKYNKMSFLGYTTQFEITSEFVDKMRSVARIFSYGICLFLLLFVLIDHDMGQKESYFYFFEQYEKKFMQLLGYIQLFFTLIFFSLWAKMRLPLCLTKRQNRLKEEAGQQEAAPDEEQQEDQQVVQLAEGEEEVAQAKPKPPADYLGKVIFYAIYVSQMVFKVINSISTLGTWFNKKFNKMMEMPGFSHVSRWLHLIFDPVYSFLESIVISFLALMEFEGSFLSILVFVIAALLGNFYGNQWYVIHIFQIFVGVPQLANVSKAILDNIGELTLLSLFATCFIFTFNILSINSFAPVMYEDEVPAQSCAQIVGCVLQMYTTGVAQSDMDQIYLDRLFLGIIYATIIGTIIGDLTSGLMIDTYGSLKESDAERDLDKSSICYICAMTKQDMQKYGQTFNKHTLKHFLWYYVFYRYVIKLKDPSDYTGLEYSIAKQIDEKNIDWFPQNGVKDQGGEAEELVGELQGKLTELGNCVDHFITNSSGILSENNTKMQKAFGEYKKRIADGIFNEDLPAANA